MLNWELEVWGGMLVPLGDQFGVATSPASPSHRGDRWVSPPTLPGAALVLQHVYSDLFFFLIKTSLFPLILNVFY